MLQSAALYVYNFLQLYSSELTVNNLKNELKTLTKPKPFGISLRIPPEKLEIIEQDNKFGKIVVMLTNVIKL